MSYKNIKPYTISFFYKGEKKLFLGLGFCFIPTDFVFYDLLGKKHWFNPKYIEKLRIEVML